MQMPRTTLASAHEQAEGRAFRRPRSIGCHRAERRTAPDEARRGSPHPVPGHAPRVGGEGGSDALETTNIGS